MNIFNDKPMLLKIVFGLLVLYLLLTISLLISSVDISDRDQFRIIKHIGMVILNIFLLKSINRFLNYMAIIWIAFISYKLYAYYYSLITSSNRMIVEILKSIDGIRVIILSAALSILVYKVLSNYYARQEKDVEVDT